MYDGPDTSYNQIGVVFDGQLAKVTGRNPDTGWWRVVCPDDTVGNCWLPDDTAYTLATESENPTSTLPNPAELPAKTTELSSPDGRWQATVTQTYPVLINDFERFYVALSFTDGSSTWTPIDEWRNYGLGYSCARLSRLIIRQPLSLLWQYGSTRWLCCLHEWHRFWCVNSRISHYPYKEQRRIGMI